MAPMIYPDVSVRPELNGSETGNVISQANSIEIGISAVVKKPIRKQDGKSKYKLLLNRTPSTKALNKHDNPQQDTITFLYAFVLSTILLKTPEPMTPEIKNNAPK